MRSVRALVRDELWDQAQGRVDGQIGPRVRDHAWISLRLEDNPPRVLARDEMKTQIIRQILRARRNEL